MANMFSEILLLLVDSAFPCTNSVQGIGIYFLTKKYIIF